MLQQHRGFGPKMWDSKLFCKEVWSSVCSKWWGEGMFQKWHYCPHAAFKIPPRCCSSSLVQFALQGRRVLIFCQSKFFNPAHCQFRWCQSQHKSKEWAVGGSRPSLQQQLSRANTAVLLISTLRFFTKHWAVFWSQKWKCKDFMTWLQVLPMAKSPSNTCSS